MEQVKEKAIARAKWIIRRFNSREFDTHGMDAKLLSPPSVIDFNFLLNEGITALQNLLTGAAETAFNNANAYLGVGDSTTAAAATQTGLQAAVNKLYVGMETSYPSISGQVTTWRAVFGSAQANFSWQEFTVANGNSDAADNLNRKVSDQGTKASGQTWTLDLQITWS